MTTSWTDEGASSPSVRVASNVTAIKAIHVNELQAAINAERTRRGSAAYAWTSFPAVVGDVSGVLKTHIEQLRDAMPDTSCPSDGYPIPVWTDLSISVNSTPDKTAHINELRVQLNKMESVTCLCHCHGHCGCNCNRHCR